MEMNVGRLIPSPGITSGKGRDCLDRLHFTRSRIEVKGRDARLLFIGDEEIRQAWVKHRISWGRSCGRRKHFDIRQSSGTRVCAIDVEIVCSHVARNDETI